MKSVMAENSEIRQKVLEYLKKEVSRKGQTWVRSSHAAPELGLKTKQFGAAMRALRVATESNDPNMDLTVGKHTKSWIVRKK